MTLSGVLPPFTGSGPVARSSVSPYLVSAREFVSRYCSSPERASLLAGFFEYRRELRAAGIVDGFQWIDGSFIEDAEKFRGRPPEDIDIVTFGERPAGYTEKDAWAEWCTAHVTVCLDTDAIKGRYHCHSFFIDLGKAPGFLVKDTSYWYGLFSHQRGTAVWKGMVELPLVSDDAAAVQILEGVLDGQTA